MPEQLPKNLPINIILISYNRLKMLERTIRAINDRTRYPFKLFVVDNNSTDGSREHLKHAKVVGEIFDHLFLEENEGQSVALNHGFKWMQEWEQRRKSDDLFLTTNEDIIPPLFKSGPCWLERQKHLFEKNEEEYNIGGIAHRIERTSRVDIDESKELIRLFKTLPSVFRMLRRSDFDKLGENPFGTLKHWDSNSMGETMRTRLQKYFYMATNLYSSHIGYSEANKGYPPEDKEFYTYSGEDKMNLWKQKPYPDIDPNTNIPLKVNHPCDVAEHKLREEYWAVDAGIQNPTIKHRAEKEILKEYCVGEKVLDLGCGREKCTPNCTGMDLYPYNSVDILHNVEDLWMFKDGEIDAIVCSHLIEHILDVKKVLLEWNRVLKVGGILGIAFPDAARKPSTIIEPSHKHAFTKNIMYRLIKNFLGHEIIRLEDVVGARAGMVCVSKKIK